MTEVLTGWSFHPKESTSEYKWSLGIEVHFELVGNHDDMTSKEISDIECTLWSIVPEMQKR